MLPLDFKSEGKYYTLLILEFVFISVNQLFFKLSPLGKTSIYGKKLMVFYWKNNMRNLSSTWTE